MMRMIRSILRLAEQWRIGFLAMLRKVKAIEKST